LSHDLVALALFSSCYLSSHPLRRLVLILVALRRSFPFTADPTLGTPENPFVKFGTHGIEAGVRIEPFLVSSRGISGQGFGGRRGVRRIDGIGIIVLLSLGLFLGFLGLR